MWDPLDGDVDPSQLTQAYARLAREAGCRIERFTQVTSLDRGSSGEWLVGTDKGEIIRPRSWSTPPAIAPARSGLVGRPCLIVAMQHQYLVTEDVRALVERGQERLPLLRDPDVSYYLRQERRASCSGPTNGSAAPTGTTASRRISPSSSAPTIWTGWNAISRTPVPACRSCRTAGVKRVVNGPIPYTPDGNPLIGPAPG